MNMSNDSCAGMDEVKETALGAYSVLYSCRN